MNMKNRYPTKVVLAGALGGAIEFYDFAVYGTLAVYFAPLFFPSEVKYLSMLGAYSVFAIGFFARPLGSLVFGYIGDKYGRKTSLFWSLMLMALATPIIGVLPTYAEIGVLAPIILITARILQGVSAGGEFSGSLILAIESGPKKKSGLIGSSVVSGCMSGIAFGSLAAYVCALPNMPSYSWRVPFLAGFVISMIGIYVRFKINESPEFKKFKTKQLVTNPKKTLKDKKNDYRNLLAVIGLSGFNSIIGYLFYIFIADYLLLSASISAASAKLYTAICTFILMFLIPLFGWISDYVSRIKMITAGAILTIITSTLLLTNISSLPAHLALLYQVCYVVTFSMFTGPLNTYIAEVFTVGIRYRFAAVGYSLGTGFIGGSAPLIAGFLSMSSNNGIFLSSYLLTTGIIALISLYIIQNSKKNRHKHLILSSSQKVPTLFL